MRLIFIAISVFVFSSCVTRKRCAEKFPPQIVTKDSIIEKEIITYRDTTITVPGDSVQIHDSIPCPDVVYKKTATSKGGKTTATVSINRGKLSVSCKTDSLRAVVDSLVTVDKTREVYKTETVIHEVPVIKYKVPRWVWWYILLSIGYAVFENRNLIIKLIRK